MPFLNGYRQDAFRFVGDPVDVVTGAYTIRRCELNLDGPLPLKWYHFYDSSQNHHRYALGWGHSHGYDWQLVLDVDGVRLNGPVGIGFGFQPLSRDGEESINQGVTLERITALHYRVYRPDEPVKEFVFRERSKTAPLQRLSFGTCSIDFKYDQSLRLIGIKDSLDRLIHVKNDTDGHILELTLTDADKDNLRTLLKYQYDDNGNLVEGADAFLHKFSFQYDLDHHMVKRTDRRGYSFFFEYDKLGHCTRSAGQDGLHDIRLHYLPESSGTVVTKADGGKWLYLYDNSGRITQIVDPYGGVQAFMIDATGQLSNQIDANGNSFELVYDSDSGAFLGMRDSFGRFKGEGEDTFSNPHLREYTPDTPFTWEMGSDWDFSAFRLPKARSLFSVPLYNTLARLVQSAPQQQMQTQPTSGWQSSKKPLGPGDYKYDIFGNLVQYIDPAGGTQRFLYDANGNIIHHIDAQGSSWLTEYTSWNLLIRQTNPLEDLTQYEYTQAEKLSRLIDPGGTISNFNYDLKDRLTTRTRHGSVKDAFQYDLADNLIEQRDAHGQTFFTVLVRPVNVPESIRFASGQTHMFRYDDYGRLIAAVNDTGEVKRKFDGLDNLIVDERDGLGVKHTYRGFNLQETTVFNRFRTTFEIEKDGTRSITDPLGGKHQVSCLGNGVFARSLANGIEEISQYDWEGRCRLKAALSSRNRYLLWSRQYHYSEVGSLVQVEDTDFGTIRYQYDSAHRLSRELRPSIGEQVYEFDDAGNLIKAPHLTAVTVDENRLLAANNNHFVYNHRNHIAQRISDEGTTAYEYINDQLVACRTPDGKWTASYDALGRRVSKSWKGDTTVFHWDRERLIAETFPDGRIRVYVYLHAHARVPFIFIEYDSVNAKPDTGRRYYIFTNQVGCPILITDDSREVVWRAKVDPYGKATVHEKCNITFHLRFPGHYFDEETGLHYNRYRYYSPELGRYIQSDPTDIEGGINVYAYTKDPLIEVDIDGCGDCPNKLTEKEQKELEEKIAEAKRLAEDLRNLMKNKKTGRFRPLPEIDPETGKQKIGPDGNPVWDGPDPKKQITAHDNTTLAVNVIRDPETGELKTVVTSSGGPAAVPKTVRDHLDDQGVPLSSPKRRTSEQVAADREAGGGKDTGNHAEQKGDRIANQEGGELASTTPTRPCCPGCTKALQNRNGPNSDSNLDVVNPIDNEKKTTKG